ncbi:hypothetical protein M2459_000683 [Parabacteroides sp. PF5-5]|uniref:DUF6807 domain-containing protein n=1 Tax=unclassified Parabacteroides TaxID=2649774 RepID=UPI00247680F8|nr:MULTISPECIES: PmoA family protein [unclassified Parabacteroides]MDH6303383.1 hypothetical protein [Parabacteroides sp. PH5-39]MDH6314706.1 hypothetical protein [Parabacteroides sp. PF5-13]MDH6318043.1 hypothetical protein [Parabacteroides sp. PH5-13]MDH6322026.1 hypothetical protein [Parabacteroides sp. PH5-8]MDH6326149.1 hypothetical protein [Parabacteroides sp. PH5-41]
MKREVKSFVIIILLALSSFAAYAQHSDISFVELPDEQAVEVYVNDQLFTIFLYSDTLRKQILYPLYTASGKTITRGYPIDTQPDEKTDHPHQAGLWFTFGDVNGLDFWNNSFRISEADRCKYGTVSFLYINRIDPDYGELAVEATWKDCHGNELLHEHTTYVFDGAEAWRSIRRETILTALQDTVVLDDNKEGLLGLRVSRWLEEDVSGLYTNHLGDKGADVWGKRSHWVSLSGMKDGELVSIAIVDHPDNPNYPAWAHARGYGLFAINNLGGTAFDEMAEKARITLTKDSSISFRHTILIKDGNSITPEEIADKACPCLW